MLRAREAAPMKLNDSTKMERMTPSRASDAGIVSETDEQQAREFIAELVDVTEELAELIASVNSEPD
jgi:hypothetical protein